MYGSSTLLLSQNYPMGLFHFYITLANIKLIAGHTYHWTPWVYYLKQIFKSKKVSFKNDNHDLINDLWRVFFVRFDMSTCLNLNK